MPLRIENLSKRNGNNWSLRDVEFEVGDGEVFGVFGGTAAGKTALLRCIAGLDKLNGGSVFSAGTDITSTAADRRDVYFSESRKDNGRGLFGRKTPSRSCGETRIVDLETALASNKTVILLDEPLAGVDANQREHLFTKIREIAQTGRTVIYASSDFEQIASVCNRVAVLVGGYVSQIGIPQEVYENPESASVAAIVGRNNLFQARRLTSTNAVLPEFLTIDGEHRLYAQQTEKKNLGAINQNVTLAIRPEQISITFGASFPEDNLLRAIVTAIHFRGETTLVQLDANGLKLEARVFRIVGLNLGDECMIGMPPHLIQVLKY